MHRKIVVPNIELLDDVAKIIASGEHVTLRTKGQSMLPFIVGGRDSVELAPIIEEVREGDILLAKLSYPTPCYVIHRVIRVEEEGVTLMGDGNILGTEQCTKRDIVARVISIQKPKRNVDPNTKRQRVYASIWLILRPIRRYLLAIIRRM